MRILAFLETVDAATAEPPSLLRGMTGSTVDGEDVIQDALFDDYTIEEIADFVESTPGQLKEALHRGHEKLVGSRRSWAAVPKKSPIRGGEIGVIDALAMSGRDVSYRDDKD